jgi:hypothetical protein
MGRFWQFVSTAGTATAGKLPLVHATDLYHFRDIQHDSTLVPSDCDVYKTEKLLYFFYGRPSYRPHAQKDTVTAKALLPICLVMSRNLIGRAVRIMPFDTGAFERRLMHPPMHTAMKKEDFELAIDPDAPMEMISIFYATENDYFDARAKAIVSGYDSYEDLEIDSYFRLLHHRANTEFDDRVTAIEIQVDSPIGLAGQVHAIVLPKPFLDRPGISAQIDKWGAIAIPYSVKEEFIPREIQGAIFQRLADYFLASGFLEPS